jgi:O-antigen/teichoic acid export membrane protein
MTAAPKSSIAHRTAIGASWMILWRMATRGLGLLSMLALARILVPADFGLVAIATAYVAAFDALSVTGLQDAVIRSARQDRQLLDTAFSLSAVRGLINGALIAASAPLAAHYFAEARLLPILLVLAGLAVLEGVENIGVVEFRRDLRFDREFMLFLLPRLLAVIITVSFAIVLHSYWAMIIGIVASRTVRFLLTYVMHAYRPRLGLGAWRQIFAFSFWTWASSIATFVRDRSWTVVLGGILEPASVGVFMVASEIALLPISEVVYPACRALFSGFSLARNEGGSLGQAFVRTIAVIAVLVIPAAIGISATANDIVDIALGPNWTATIIIIELIAASSPMSVLALMGATTLLASAHVRNNFVIVLASAVLGTASTAVMAIKFGLPGVAVSTAVFAALEGIAFLAMISRTIGVPVVEFGRNLWRPALATAIMAGVLWLSGYGWRGQPASATINGLVNIPIGTGVYAATLALAWVSAGKPEGAETFLFKTLQRGFSGMRSRNPS